MARPKKSVEDTWLDLFVDMPVEDQAANLRLLEQFHRQALRERRKKVTQRVEESKPAVANDPEVSHG